MGADTGLSRSLPDVAKAGGLNLAGFDESALLALTDRAGQLAMQIRHPGEEVFGEAPVELLAHRGISVQPCVAISPFAQAVVERVRSAWADGRAPVEVPARGLFVEAVEGVLVDDEPTGGPQKRRDLVERGREVGDVVQREARHNGIEGVWIGERFQGGGVKQIPRRGVGIDRYHPVPGASDRPREIAAATAHLEYPSRRGREVPGYERVQTHRFPNDLG